MKTINKKVSRAFTLTTLGSIVFAALLIFSMSACSDDTGGPASTLTITDIPDRYNGQYAVFSVGVRSNNFFLYGNGGENGNIVTLVPISNGKVAFPLKISNSFTDYIGNDTITTDTTQNSEGYWRSYLQMQIYNTSTYDSSRVDDAYWDNIWVANVFFDTVTFKNGSATLSYTRDRL